MSNVEFGGPKLFPVINNEHVKGNLRDTEKVLSAGADGVFLINHAHNATTLLTRYEAVSREFPDAPVGINFWNMRNPFDVYELLNRSGVAPYAVWTDWYYSLDTGQMENFKSLTPTRDTHRTILFAGVSHKAASYTEDPFLSAQLARMADRSVDYVTTTGSGTGLPVPMEKLAAMRDAIKYSKLAVASGVSVENVDSVVPLVDAILVASSLESSFGEIDDDRLRMFMLAFRHAVRLEQETRERLAHPELAEEPLPDPQLHLDFSFDAGRE